MYSNSMHTGFGNDTTDRTSELRPRNRDGNRVYTGSRNGGSGIWIETEYLSDHRIMAHRYGYRQYTFLFI